MSDKIIIAGGRDFNDRPLVDIAMDNLCSGLLRRNSRNILGDIFSVEIVSGGARGADYIGEEWARAFDQKLTIMRAQWDQFGRSAGPKRNLDMAKYADTLVAFWDGKSRGTGHMIDIALKEGLEVHVYRYSNEV